jgi:hypothetical protein
VCAVQVHGNHWVSNEVKFHVGPADHGNAFQHKAIPCTAIQDAAVHGCASNCDRCGPKLAVLEGLVTKDGYACETAAGEDAVQVMKLAIKDCGAAPAPEPGGR